MSCCSCISALWASDCFDSSLPAALAAALPKCSLAGDTARKLWVQVRYTGYGHASYLAWSSALCFLPVRTSSRN